MSRGLFLSSISRIALTADERAADSGSSSSFSSLPVCPHSIGPDLFIMSEIEHLYKTPAHVPIPSPLPLCLLPGAGRERPRDRPMYDERRDQPVPQLLWL